MYPKVFFLFIIAITLTACSNPKQKALEDLLENGTLQELKDEHLKVAASYDSVANVLSQLEMAIARQDTTKRYALVTPFKVKDTVFTNQISIQGSVDTDENILVFPEYQGVLTKLYVNQGQQVQKGQLLAKIDDGGLSNQLAQLQAQYDLAQTTYERQERLWKQNIGSEIQYLQAQTNRNAADNAVKQLQAQLGRTVVNAPFAGVVDDIIIEQGQVVSPGAQAILRLVNLDHMHVKASIPENYLTSISKGSIVEVTFPAIGKTIQGTIQTVGNFINPRNRTFEIEVAVPNGSKDIKPNLMANLHIVNYSNPNAIIVPTNAIQENSMGEKFVFVLEPLENNQYKALKTKVELGPKNNGMVEIDKGLQKDALIALEGALTLKDNEVVTIADKP